MKNPLFAVLLSLAAAPAFSQSAPLTPIPMGPAASGQCVIGSEGCGLARGASMDPVSENALVGLGQMVVPSLGDAAAKAAAKAAAGAGAKVPNPGDPDGGTDLVAIGGRIINPLGAANGAFRSATGMNLGASAAAAAVAAGRPSESSFDTHVDGSGIAAPSSGKATGLSYINTQKVEATLGGKADAFGSDPKLSAGDADFGPGGTSASSNGSR